MKYPSVNYIGNKEKIVNWIISLIPKDASSILDLFAGGCSVSYAAKLTGMTVYTNDILKISSSDLTKILGELVEQSKL